MPRASVREVIVETAVQEIHKYGYAACSVDTITKAAGVPKGSFYNHFKSKEDLGAEVVRRYAAESEWNRTTPGLSPLERLRARFTTMKDILIGNEYTRGCLIGNMAAERADHSDVIRTQVALSLTSWSDGITEEIEQAQAAGEISEKLDARQLGRFVLNAWEGTLLRAKADKNTQPIEDFFTVVFDTVLR
ncbi:TetR/AcrR family transcriptional regulator [Kibdelosporangium philippinense]|uniref:TetR/AcrR family transcriptional regulator n=1 Tax=Kibdelosporangium philippinense TaxID=211113 RepID=A0ABS8Z9Y9_9PSEU|nr:TetR/AcrR family transcriptional regulator [Kibdelosporangium philippinense]MCE7002667.1 TetR/AcrR family transcriptional regulator [Kibdelosporangium philippinense]